MRLPHFMAIGKGIVASGARLSRRIRRLADIVELPGGHAV